MAKSTSMGKIWVYSNEVAAECPRCGCQVTMVIAENNRRYETQLPPDFGSRCPVVAANLRTGKRGHEAIACPHLEAAEAAVMDKHRR